MSILSTDLINKEFEADRQTERQTECSCLFGCVCVYLCVGAGVFVFVLDRERNF